MDGLKQILRELTRRKNQLYLGLDLQIEDLTLNFPIYDHLMSMILISSPECRITFKIHFSPRSIQNWVASVYKADTKSLSREQMIDFTKELCNLSAGAIKYEFELRKLNFGISLPLTSRGFDEIFYPLPDGKTTFGDAWKLYSPHGQVTCSIYCELVDSTFLSRLDLSSLLTDDTLSGEVEEL